MSEFEHFLSKKDEKAIVGAIQKAEKTFALYLVALYR